MVQADFKTTAKPFNAFASLGPVGANPPGNRTARGEEILRGTAGGCPISTRLGLSSICRFMLTEPGSLATHSRSGTMRLTPAPFDRISLIPHNFSRYHQLSTQPVAGQEIRR